MIHARAKIHDMKHIYMKQLINVQVEMDSCKMRDTFWYRFLQGKHAVLCQIISDLRSLELWMTYGKEEETEYQAESLPAHDRVRLEICEGDTTT